MSIGGFFKGLGKGLFGGGGSSGLLGTGSFKTTVDPYFRNEIKGLAGQLAKQSRGEGSSVEEETLRATQNKNLAQSQAGINSIGGLSPALRQRMIQNQSAQTGSDIASQGAILRAKEQAQARSSLGALLAGEEKNLLGEQTLKERSFSDTAGRRQSALKGLGAAFGLG